MILSPGKSPQPPIIIIGMHRSGTTLLTRILSDLEVFVGPQVSPNFEDVYFQQINRQLLASEGAHWANPMPFVSRLKDEKFIRQKATLAQSLLAEYTTHYQELASGQLWAWKDPRNTLTLPVWLTIFPEARVIHLIRNGIEVALSLQRREIRRYFRPTRDNRMFPPTISRAYHLWQQYVETGISWNPICAYWWQTHFTEFCANPVTQLETMCQSLNINMPTQRFAEATAQIRETTPPSRFEQQWTQLLWKMNMLDHRPMIELGYAKQKQ
ncbi:MAG TPA: sulfotransferase [Chloroflexota bacterium]|nr:sulfotransferase [Chloroflexota bacterium]HUM69055.1 sulfotransferase [Chloroflexota bacterium]